MNTTPETQAFPGAPVNTTPETQAFPGAPVNRIATARAALADLRDPEIPTAQVTELGMLLDVREEDGTLIVEILPTFTGCPAIAVIVDDVEAALQGAGVGPVRVITRADLPWSTDMITATGRRQLAEFGIVPPQRRRLQVEEITCPICHARNVALVSRFGPTPCRAMAKCRDCGEPLEVFKPIGAEARSGVLSE